MTRASTHSRPGEEVFALGIDVGGTHARVAVVDAAGRIAASQKAVLADRAPERVVEAIAGAVNAALEEAGQPGVSGCGVGVAGQLRGDSGVMAVAPNLGWREVPFGRLLSERLDRAVHVFNDLKVAAWGELKVGAGQGAQDVLVVFAGSGVGSAVIAGGRLLFGATGVSGELGHIKVVPGGRRCGCGEQGCLEAYAGGHNLIAQMREAAERDGGSALAEASRRGALNPVLLEQLAQQGDPAASEIYQRAASFLGLAVANLVTVLNPARLVIGGGVLSHCPGLRQAIRSSVETNASRTSRESLVIAEAALGDDSGVVGAALLALE